MGGSEELCDRGAVELAALLRGGEVSAREVVAAHLARIERVDPLVGAFCTVVGDRALDAARAADDALARGGPVGPLHGLPVGIKDLHRTRGIRTTFGSPIYAEFVPDVDDLVVERLVGAGAIVVGKTNTPEFGAGAQTFNAVFGETRNPYDTARTCGGSSGGSAVAVACGMVPLADGSDFGGSLRIPASFCEVVGLRPAPGRVPTWPAELGWQTLSVQGPMARTVPDLSLALSAMAGPDARSPIAIDEPGRVFDPAGLDADVAGTRVAWTVDLGRYPVAPEVAEVVQAALGTFADLGCRVEEAHPDLTGADEAFRVLRAWLFAEKHREHLAHHRELMKDDLVWNVERGLELDGSAVSRAEVARTEIYHRARTFLEEHDVLVLPTAPVAPFPVEQRWVTEVAGVALETYLDWLGLCSAVTVTSLPSISVPCGRTAAGLPVGLQVVGRPRGERALLRLAHAFHQRATAAARRPPVVDRGGA